jgi:hypothetical protein
LPKHLDPVTERAQRRVGSYLRRDKYALDRLLGVGAMGAVYAATHRNGMRVAIKVLHDELSKFADLRARFLREGYIANRVKHPSLVRVLDDDVDDDSTTFLVMELLEGTTLDAEWEAAGRTMPLRRVVAIADAILDVLAAIHGEGIVHRDVKPDNVFFTADGMKLLDLGIARLLESTTTATGQIMGTPEFVAPEQAAWTGARDRRARRPVFRGRDDADATDRKPRSRGKHADAEDGLRRDQGGTIAMCHLARSAPRAGERDRRGPGIRQEPALVERRRDANGAPQRGPAHGRATGARNGPSGDDRPDGHRRGGANGSRRRHVEHRGRALGASGAKA